MGMYFLLINIVLLNVIFGIIIDTFGDLRVQKNEKYEDKMNKCFICNIDRNSFERAGHNFTSHIKEQHYMWNYLKYIVHLKLKEKSEIDWFPINRATILDTDAGDDEQKLNVDKIKE